VEERQDHSAQENQARAILEADGDGGKYRVRSWCAPLEQTASGGLATRRKSSLGHATSCIVTGIVILYTNNSKHFELDFGAVPAVPWHFVSRCLVSVSAIEFMDEERHLGSAGCSCERRYNK
jgi:hypothetical protein